MAEPPREEGPAEGEKNEWKKVETPVGPEFDTNRNKGRPAVSCPFPVLSLSLQ